MRWPWTSRRQRLLEPEIEAPEDDHPDRRGARARRAREKPRKPPAGGTGVKRSDDGTADR